MLRDDRSHLPVNMAHGRLRKQERKPLSLLDPEHEREIFSKEVRVSGVLMNVTIKLSKTKVYFDAYAPGLYNEEAMKPGRSFQTWLWRSRFQQMILAVDD